MSENLFGLREFRDAGAFLSGAIIPLVPLPEFGPPAEASVYWCRDHMILSEAGFENALRAEARDGKDFDVASLDLSDPDVIRWCDRKIGEAHGYEDVTAARIGGRRRDGQCRFEMTLLIGADRVVYFDLIAPVLADMPRDNEHIPCARAALLRAYYGSANV